MFFFHNCKRNTVAETLPPSSEDLKEKLKAVEVDTKAPGWTESAETWVNWAASNPTKLVTEFHHSMNHSNGLMHFF